MYDSYQQDRKTMFSECICWICILNPSKKMECVTFPRIVNLIVISSLSSNFVVTKVAGYGLGYLGEYCACSFGDVMPNYDV